MLSDRAIKSLKPIGRDKLLSDGNGLYLRLSRHGTKSFLYRSREGGTARYLTLGTYPHLTLSEARKKALEHQGRAVGIITVGYAVERYLAHLPYLRPEQVKRRFAQDILPKLGKDRLAAVTAQDLTDTLQPILDRGSLVAANRTLADLKHLFAFAHERGWVRENVAQRITRKVIGGKEKSREIVLTDDELKDLISELRSDRWETKTRAGLALCLLTGQRASEVLSLKASGPWWTIPKEITKSKREHKVYLVPLARHLSQFIEPCDHRTLSRALNRAKKRYTPHDLRRTMATKLSDLGVMPHVIEKMLNHQMIGVMAIYNRAEFLEERKAAWKLWRNYLKSLWVKDSSK